MSRATLEPFYVSVYNPPGILVPVPPQVFEVYRGAQKRCHLRAPKTIDFDALLKSVKKGDVVTIRESGRNPWKHAEASI